MSYRNDTNATYDSTLLSNVPDPTRAERQGGYNVDILDEGRKPSSPPDTGPVPTTDQQPLTHDYSPGAVALAHKEGQLENGTKPAVTPSWYRSRWGMAAIVIVIVLIIGAIVGGAVAGTHHTSHKSSSNGPVTTSTSGSGSNGTGGQSSPTQASNNTGPLSGTPNISNNTGNTSPELGNPGGASSTGRSSRTTPNAFNSEGPSTPAASPSSGGTA